VFFMRVFQEHGGTLSSLPPNLRMHSLSYNVLFPNKSL
jgi:hypothetical protein